MQVAILLVLIVIACVLAPWLLGLAAAAAAVYGVFFVTAIAVALIGLPFIAAALWVLKRRSGHRSPEQIMADRAKAFNRQYLEEAANRQKKVAVVQDRHAAQPSHAAPSAEPALEEIVCVRCSHVFPAGALVCPSCGKSPPISGI